MRRSYFIVLMLGCVLLLTECGKSKCDCVPPPTSSSKKLSYGDSVFYLRAQEYTIKPLISKAGTYKAFPNNLLIDSTTGVITVKVIGLGDESQTGLRYKITFKPTGSGQSDSTFIVLSGINYLDRIYNLSKNETVIRPIYNADITKQLPPGTYGIQADNRIEINTQNGEINILECLRKGLFDLPSKTGEWEEVTISYKSNDGSNSEVNHIDIALYYYKTVSDIPSNVTNLMRAHQAQVLGIPQQAIPLTSAPIDNNLPDNVSYSKPRPPCVIIVGN